MKKISGLEYARDPDSPQLCESVWCTRAGLYEVTEYRAGKFRIGPNLTIP